MKILVPNMLPSQPQGANFCDFGVESANSVSPFVEALFDRPSAASVRPFCSFSSLFLSPNRRHPDWRKRNGRRCLKT